MVKCLDQFIGDDYAAYNGDCCEVMAGLPDESIGFSVFSPPFADLYCYSESTRDLGNCRTMEEFFQHFGVVIDNLYRILMPGRIVAVHCMELPSAKEREGVIGMKDFPGDIIRCFQDHGFIYHSPRVTIWKDPLVAAVRTKALGLLHKQLMKDSAMCRTGIPDYVLGFRKPGNNPVPIAHPQGLCEYAGANDPGGHGEKRSHYIWQRYASPVWDDIRQTNVMPYREARDGNDDKHICPLQLDVITRCVVLWSNPGETVFTPFMGVGSEVCGAIVNGRKGVGVELKPSYYEQAIGNIPIAVNDRKQRDLPLLTEPEA